MMLPLWGQQILLALGQAPATAALAQQYLSGLAWGTTPALWFLAIRGFMSAVNRPEPGLWITLGAIPAQERTACELRPRFLKNPRHGRRDVGYNLPGTIGVGSCHGCSSIAE